MARGAQGSAGAGEGADQGPRRAERGPPPAADGGIDKAYVFEVPRGAASLLDLFEGRRELIVEHVMFDPRWDEGCRSCAGRIDNIGRLEHLHARDTTLVAVSPLVTIEPFKARIGWRLPWYSSFGSDFNYDFHVTLDASVAPVEYNYRTEAEFTAMGTPIDSRSRWSCPGRACSSATATASSTPTLRTPGAPSLLVDVLLPRPDFAGPPGGLGGAARPGCRCPRQATKASLQGRVRPVELAALTGYHKPVLLPIRSTPVPLDCLRHTTAKPGVRMSGAEDLDRLPSDQQLKIALETINAFAGRVVNADTKIATLSTAQVLLAVFMATQPLAEAWPADSPTRILALVTLIVFVVSTMTAVRHLGAALRPRMLTGSSLNHFIFPSVARVNPDQLGKVSPEAMISQAWAQVHALSVIAVARYRHFSRALTWACLSVCSVVTWLFVVNQI